MADSKKRTFDGANDGPDKRSKTKRQWKTPRKGGDPNAISKRDLQPGDCGIWATCDKGREGKCVNELRNLFAEYAEMLYPNAGQPDGGDEAKNNDDASDSIEKGIESEIAQELEGIKKPGNSQLFTSVMLDVQCVVFIKTRPPVDPVSFVHRILQDAAQDPRRKRTRFTKRLSPMTAMARASPEGLESVAATVLAPHFHATPLVPRKFAIRPTLRNHSVLTRDSIIKQVAPAVGPGHSVDLKGYDLLILVEVYRNVCGMSVVPGDFEDLKRYNLAEIFDPTPKEAPKEAPENAPEEASTEIVAVPATDAPTEASKEPTTGLQSDARIKTPTEATAQVPAEVTTSSPT